MSRSNSASVLWISSLLACFILIQRVADANNIERINAKVTVNENEAAQLKCRFENNTGDIVYWKKVSTAQTFNGTISGGSGRNNEFTTTLTLRDVKQKDSGAYRCLLDNEIDGSLASQSVTLIVNKSASKLQTGEVTAKLKPTKNGTDLKWLANNVKKELKFVRMECSTDGTNWENCLENFQCKESVRCPIDKFKHNATKFQYRVITNDSDGNLYISNTENFPPTPPFVPNVKVLNSTQDSIEISWKEAPVGFQLESYKITVSGREKPKEVQGSTSATIDKLECNQTYSIKVAACINEAHFDGGCDAESKEIKANTKPCNNASSISTISKSETSTFVLAIFSLYFLAKYNFN